MPTYNVYSFKKSMSRSPNFTKILLYAYIHVYEYLDLLFVYMHPTLNYILHTLTKKYLLHPVYLVEFKLHPAS